MSVGKITTAVILAAGRGSRLGSRTDHHPKAFLPFRDFTLIERSLRLLQEAGITRVYIGTGYRKDFFENITFPGLDVRCIENSGWSTSGSMQTLMEILPELEESFLLLESDLLYEAAALAILLKQPETTVLVSGKTGSGDEVWVSATNGVLTGMSKNAAELQNIVGELTGICRINESSIPLLKDVFARAEQPRMDYETALVEVSRIQGVSVFLQKDLIWCEIDDEQHLKRAHEQIWPRLWEKEKS